MYNNKPFKITSVCRDDILQAFDGDHVVLAKLHNLTDDDMRAIADKMEADYTEQLFWDSLKCIFNDYIPAAKRTN